jgi:hypothetical protein
MRERELTDRLKTWDRPRHQSPHSYSSPLSFSRTVRCLSFVKLELLHKIVKRLAARLPTVVVFTETRVGLGTKA